MASIKLLKLFKPADLIIVALMFALVVASYAYISKPTTAGKSNILIKSAGKLVTARLTPDRKVKIKGRPGYCILEIKSEKVRVIESTCENKICIKTGWISRPGENIVCLPSRIVVEIGGSDLDVSLR